MDLLGALRLCANVPGQFAIEASLHGADTITELCQPGGRLYEARRAVVESCAATEHLNLVAPAGALSAFPGITGSAAESFDDHPFAPERLETQDVLDVPGLSLKVPSPHTLQDRKNAVEGKRESGILRYKGGPGQ